MLKCALASVEMALFVCHSAEHHFAKNAFLPKFADREKGGGKELKLGFWESLVGTLSRSRWVCDIDIWKLWGGEKKNFFFFLSCLLPYKPFCHCSQFSETAVTEPYNHMNIHESTLLLCPLSCIFFFFTQRPVVLCLIGPDICKGPWIKKKKVVYDNWRTLLAAE